MIKNAIIVALLLTVSYLYKDKLDVETSHKQFLIVVEEVYAHLNMCTLKHPGCDE